MLMWEAVATLFDWGSVWVLRSRKLPISGLGPKLGMSAVYAWSNGSTDCENEQELDAVGRDGYNPRIGWVSGRSLHKT